VCKWYRFCFFLRFSIGFLNCSDGVVFFALHFIFIDRLHVFHPLLIFPVYSPFHYTLNTSAFITHYRTWKYTVRGLWCLTTLSTIFHLHHGGQFLWKYKIRTLKYITEATFWYSHVTVKNIFFLLNVTYQLNGIVYMSHNPERQNYTSEILNKSIFE